MKKKILIVSFYWPPAGGVAVQRVWQLAKNLTLLGWEVRVLSASEDSYSVNDESLMKVIGEIQTTRVEAFNVQSLLPGARKKKSNHTKVSVAGESERFFPGLANRLLNFILQFVRLNFFIPDSRIFWIKPAIEKGLKLENEAPDIVFSTAPPYSVHFVARELAQKYECPWVADFRDPWLENLTYNVAPRFPWVKKRIERMERSVIESADHITATGENLRDLYLDKVSAECADKFSVIPNGYDVDSLVASHIKPDQFTLTYIGTLYATGLREEFFRKLGTLIRENEAFGREFKFRLIGNIDSQAWEMLCRLIPLENMERVGFVSSRKVSSYLEEEQVFLVILYDVPFGECITLGKVYDYLQTTNPLLCIGQKTGDTPKILRDHGSSIYGWEEEDRYINRLLTCYQGWKESGLPQADHEILEKYTRKYQAKQFSHLFNRLIEQSS